MSAADRGGRVAPPPADPSQATGRVKRRDNQLHRARVLEVRIQPPPPMSPSQQGPRGRCRPAVIPRRRKVYVVNQVSNILSMIATASNMVTATIPVGSDS